MEMVKRLVKTEADVYQNGWSQKFAIFIRKRLFWSLFLIKFQAWRRATLLKRDSNTGFLL